MHWLEGDLAITVSDAVTEWARVRYRTEYSAFLPEAQHSNSPVWDLQRVCLVCQDLLEKRKEKFPASELLDTGLHTLELVALQQLSELIGYLNPQEQSQVLSGVAFAIRAHALQPRKSGEPFSIHVMTVTMGLARQQLDAITLTAGALHDTIEDCPSLNERPAFTELLQQFFGEEVLEPILYITKIQDIRKQHIINGDEVSWKQKLYHHLGMIPRVDKNPTEQVDELYRLQLVLSLLMPKNMTAETTKSSQLVSQEQAVLRAVLIKLQDRLHNMQTLATMSAQSQYKNARETKEVYVKIARKLGLFEVANKLADLSEQYLQPEKYPELTVLQDSVVKLNAILPQLPLEAVRNFIVAPTLAEFRVGAEFIVPGAAAMREAGQPFLTLELKVPNLESETGLSQDAALNRVTATITKHLSDHFGSKKKFLFPNMSTVMELIRSETLSTFSFYIPAPPELLPYVKLLRVNVCTDAVSSRESQSILPLLQPGAKLQQRSAALAKWQDMQQHALDYKTKFSKLFANFTSDEILLALTQRIPTGMMLVVGAPPVTSHGVERPKVPWLVPQTSTIQNYIHSIGSLRNKKIITVLINGREEQDFTQQLSPFDEITIVATKQA